MFRRFLLLTLLAVPLAAQAQAAAPTGPQPTLPKEKLVIVTKDGTKHMFDVELATTPKQQEIGEMFRKSVPENGGMLFVWDRPQVSNMWMKNTLVPLDMVFIKANGTIASIAENTVPHSLRVIQSHGPVLATLELAGGVTAKLDITVGDKVEAKQFGDAP